MSRFSDLVTSNLYLMGGVFDLKEILLLLSPEILLSTIIIVVISFTGIFESSITELLESIATVNSLALLMTYSLMILVATGKVTRISYSMRDLGILEVLLSQGNELSHILLALLTGSFLKYSIPTILGGAITLIPSFLIGEITAGELLAAFGTIIVIVILLSTIYVLMPLITNPGEAQYWSQSISLMIILGYLYFGFLNSSNSSEHFVHQLLSGYSNPESLALGAIATFFALILLVELSEERGSIEDGRGEWA